MKHNKQGLRRKIKSVNATMKITSAMELIATSKLSKQKNAMLANLAYADNFKQMVTDILINTDDDENIYTKSDDNLPRLVIVLGSDLGLCGGYNINMVKLLQSDQRTTDKVIAIGARIQRMLRNRRFNVINELNSDDLQYTDIRNILNEAVELFNNREIGAIVLAYTKFINTVNIVPVTQQLLPITAQNRATSTSYVEFSPSCASILRDLMPMYVSSMVYSYYIETKTSEQASRRMAMENATDNAEELKEKYVLQYNQARQAAITQEISEIVGGANAL
jgi:F-type H+-transporting ATPase subunit gamma